MQAFFAESTFPIGEGYFWTPHQQLSKSEFAAQGGIIMTNNRSKLRITFNAPAILTFALA